MSDFKTVSLGRTLIMTYSLLLGLLLITSIFLLTYTNLFPIDNIIEFNFEMLLNSGTYFFSYLLIIILIFIIILNINEHIIDVFINIFYIEDLISVFFTYIFFSLVFLISIILKPEVFSFVSFIWCVSSPFSIVLQPAYIRTIYYQFNRYTGLIGLISTLIGFIASYIDLEILSLTKILLTIIGSLLLIISQPIKNIKKDVE
jgi:hypothetical protein